MTRPGAPPFDPLSAAVTPALDTPLAELLAERITAHGPISFADWMDACLYHPQHGYYRREAPTVGRDGDFLTSPEVHPLFGGAVAYLVAAAWEQLGRPAPFQIAEIGPGSGALAESMLRWLYGHAQECAEALKLSLVEPNSYAAGRQQVRLRTFDTPIEWRVEIDDLSADQHLIVANELLDALPVHRLQYLDCEWRELYVAYSPSAGFHDLESQLSDARLLDPLQEHPGADASEGQIAEISPLRAEMVHRLATRLDPQRSLLLLFDYGYERERLYAPWRRDGTLLTTRNHVPSDNPYSRPGEQDISCHIDLEQFRAAARDAGLLPYSIVSQAEWLRALGAAILPPVAEAPGAMADYLAARRAIDALTDATGLGRIAVLAAARGEIGTLPGLSDGSDG